MQNRPHILGLALLISVCSVVERAQAQRHSPAVSPDLADYCLDPELAKRYGLSDLYCVNLTAIPALPQAGGFVRLEHAPSPFGVTTTRSGHLKYKLHFTILGLPEPAELGPYTAYIAWVTTPALAPMVRLGEVRNGEQFAGVTDFNKFLILITAEQADTVSDRRGRIVMRGTSPSSRMEPHDVATLSPLAALPPRGGHMGHNMTSHGWRMPPPHPAVSMAPGMMAIRPKVTPFQPSTQTDTPIPAAVPRRKYRVENGGVLELTATRVERTIHGRELVMYAFNGEHPGPLIEVEQGAEITVNFNNSLDLPSAIHWHGLRLDYRFDGVPGLTQPLVQPGESFAYTLSFPDAGIYWYHPHFREDIKMDLGMYANILVRPPDPDWLGQAHREEIIMLDDLLLDEEGVVPHGRESSNFMLMGRFGNAFLINGDPEYRLRVNKGEIVRFFVTNASNTRTYNLAIGDQRLKLVATDVGKYAREMWVDNVVIATAERYVVEARFSEPGPVYITNRVQAVNHRTGSYFLESDTLGVIHVSNEDVSPDLSELWPLLRTNQDVVDDIARYRPEFDRPVDKTVMVKLQVEGLPDVVQQLMRFDALYFNPIEWSGTMRMMNWASTGEEVQWILEDPETGKQNMQIDWKFNTGDVVKVRLINDRNSFHAMQHPIHVHGQRFLILSRDGVPTENFAWRDTMILPAGATADILMDLANPGKWMFHCHIVEHIDSGMMFVFDVAEAAR